MIRKKWKAAINCSKIVAYTVKIVRFLVFIISEYPQKSISLKFEIEIFRPCLVWKLHGPLPPLLQWLRP